MTEERQINVNLSGRVTAPPVAILDENGHRFTMTLESPTRGYFKIVTDYTPKPWGVSVYYGTKKARFILPDAPGAYEAALPPVFLDPPVLAFPSGLERITHTPTGFVKADGSPWTWAMMTGFCDYHLYMTGQDVALHKAWQQAKDLGSKGRRVLGHMRFITEAGIQVYGEQRFLDGLTPFIQMAAEYEQYIDFVVFADMQVIGLPLAQQQRVWLEAANRIDAANGFATLANENEKNGVNADDFAYPGFACSAGSGLIDALPPMPGPNKGWGRREMHTRRSPFPIKVYQGPDDAIYIQRGYDEAQAAYYAPRSPVVISEPIGFAEVAIEGRRSTDVELARSYGHSFKAYANGGTLHSEDGIYSRPLGPIQQAAARAFFEALN